MSLARRHHDFLPLTQDLAAPSITQTIGVHPTALVQVSSSSVDTSVAAPARHWRDVTELGTTQDRLRRTAVARRAVRPSPAAAGLKSVVINLRAREDRWLGVKESAQENAPWLSLERLDAVNGRDHPPAARDVCKTYSSLRLAKLFHGYRDMDLNMSRGERGCCASHLKAWRKCASSAEPLLVLEDDAVILPAFTATLNKALEEAPKDIGMLWLTKMDRGRRKRIGEVLMQPFFLWTTVGYVIWPTAARALIELLPMDLPVDNFMAWHAKEGAVRAFSVEPSCVSQANAWNVLSDVPHSDDVAVLSQPGNESNPSPC